MIKTKNIVIYGSGGLGRGLIDLINSINSSSEVKWNLLGFIDENEVNEINDYRSLGDINYLLNYTDNLNVVLAFGNPSVKEKVYEALKENVYLCFPNLIHPSVEISPYSKLGKGNIISNGVSLSTNIHINDFNLIHYNCSIGHDVLIGSYNSIFPLAAISGYTSLANGIEVGTTAAIIPDKTIGDNAVIGAGSVVIEDVDEGRTVVGVPGREI